MRLHKISWVAEYSNLGMQRKKILHPWGIDPNTAYIWQLMGFTSEVSNGQNVQESLVKMVKPENNIPRNAVYREKCK